MVCGMISIFAKIDFYIDAYTIIQMQNLTKVLSVVWLYHHCITFAFLTCFYDRMNIFCYILVFCKIFLEGAIKIFF